MIGRTLRHYLVTERLGQGGMGEVWKARDTILDRDVAIKVLPADDRNAAARKERFFREAKAASALNHPSIITIYEINSHQGIDFIAMEYVRGRTLADVLREGPLSIDLVMRYASQTAEAVGRAHVAGIVHRDLKPGNIMVNEDGLVKVLDFGLAKVGRPLSADTSQRDAVETQMALTRAGTTVGTVGYMSPEQAIGDEVDARSDVFSFGVILYQMLAGVLPFPAESRLDALRKLHFLEPRPLVTLRPDVPPTIAAIAARALAKQPADRYANLAPVAVALRDATTSIASGVNSTSDHRIAIEQKGVGALVMSRRAILAGTAAVLIVAAAAAMFWRSRATPVPSATSAEPTAVNDTAPPYELTRAAALLLERPDREGNIDRAAALLERALSQDKNHALAHAHLSDAYLRKHQANPDAQLLELARETAQRAIALNTDLAVAHQALGFVQLESGEYDEAAPEFRRAADLDPLNPLPHLGLGLLFAAQNQDAQAQVAFEKAILLAPQQWRPPSELGQHFYRRARYAEAATQWEAALKITPDNATVLKNLGAAYYMLGRFDEAASTFQRALEINPTAATYTNLGTIRFFQGRFADAVPAFEKAVELGANRYQFWGNLGDALRWAPGRRGEAPATYRRASGLIKLEIAKKPEDPDLRTRHALFLIKMGDSTAALNEIEGLADRAPLTPQHLYRLTVVYELAGDRRRALELLEDALKAGYPLKEVQSEPELIALRADARYHRLIDTIASASPRP
jgi:eukaryotic-like serine/threonine-protein kinase